MSWDMSKRKVFQMKDDLNAQNTFEIPTWQDGGNAGDALL